MAAQLRSHLYRHGSKEKKYENLGGLTKRVGNASLIIVSNIIEKSNFQLNLHATRYVLKRKFYAETYMDFDKDRDLFSSHCWVCRVRRCLNQFLCAIFLMLLNR